MEQAAQLNYVAADDDTAANCFQLNPHYQHHNDMRERQRSKRMYSLHELTCQG